MWRYDQGNCTHVQSLKCVLCDQTLCLDKRNNSKFTIFEAHPSLAKQDKLVHLECEIVNQPPTF
jgi:hypothetical protein